MTVETLGYCGARCPKCFAYRKNVSEAAKGLRRELRAEKLKESWKEFPFLADYASFKKSLDGLAMLRCTKMCRGGGGGRVQEVTPGLPAQPRQDSARWAREVPGRSLAARLRPD
jgi:hypothetical protein